MTSPLFIKERRPRRYRKKSQIIVGVGGGERLREWPEERMKTVVAALLLFASSLCTSLSLSFLNEVVPRDRPLNDIVFQLIPIQEWAWPASDMIVLTMAVVFGVSILLHRYRWIVMRRLFLIASILYFCRSLAMVVTWVPLSDRTMLTKCITPQSQRNVHQENIDIEAADQKSTSGIPWSMIGLRMWQYGISLGFVGVESNRVLCGDYIYSGHTLMYVLTTLAMRTYMPRTGFYRLLRYLYPLAAVTGMFFVTISRLHYTIDVVIAYWMTTLTFWCYHLLIALPRPPPSSSTYGGENRSNSTMILESTKLINQNESTILTITPTDEDDYENSGEEIDGDETENLWWRQTYFGRGSNSISFLFGSRYVLDYFEKNVPAGVPIPRELNWPYSRPAWLCRLVNSMNETSILSSDD